MQKSKEKSFYFFLVNSTLTKKGSIGMRAEKIINFLVNEGNEVFVVSRDRFLPDNALVEHRSYFFYALFFKLLKFIRVYIYGGLSDRLIESIFLDFYSAKLLKQIKDKGWHKKKVISFEFAPKLIKVAEELGFNYVQDVQILPTSFSEELYKNGEIKKFKKNFFLNKLIDREEFSLKVSRNLIVPSEFVRRYILRKIRIDENQIKICPFGVDLKRFKEIEVSKRKDKRKQSLTFGFFGAISERKGLRYLLQGFDDPFFKNDYLLVGGNLQKTSIDFSLKEYSSKNIKFLGHVEPEEFYKQIDVLVHPSLVEGSAKVVYEAMASGIIPIATMNTGSIIEHEVDGFIIKSSDVEDINLRLKFVKENFPLHKLKESMSNKIQNFSWEAYASNYSKIL